MHTPYQALAVASRLVGQPIRYPMGSELTRWEITDEKVSLVFITSRLVSRKHGMTCTHKGMKALAWTLVDGAWVAVHPVVIEWKLDTPEFWTATTPRSRLEELEQYAWENLCYRPGTAWDPRDSYSRELQGY